MTKCQCHFKDQNVKYINTYIEFLTSNIKYFCYIFIFNKALENINNLFGNYHWTRFIYFPRTTFENPIFCIIRIFRMGFWNEVFK